jgi:nicotinamidase-related amidase
MDNNKINLKKTAVLYFDMLNGYFHGMDKAAKARKKPMVDNAVRIMRAARTAASQFILHKAVTGRTEAMLSYC